MHPLLQKIIVEWRYSPVIAGGGVLIVLAAFYAFSGVFVEENALWYFSSVREYQGMVLLLTLMPAYIVTSAIYSHRRTLELAKDIDAINGSQLEVAVNNLSALGLVTSTLLGLAYAIAFNIPGNATNFFTASSAERAVIIGQMLIWSLLGLLLYVRIKVARAFRHTSETVSVDIYEPSNLRTFARNALTDVLVIMLGLVLSTVQSLDFSFRPDNYSKALIILIPAIAYLAVYPIWGLHRRMLAKRQQQLVELNALIRDASKSLDAAEMQNLEILLQRRERVNSAFTWPVDVSILQRFFFYIIIPPLAWIGAALVEYLLEGFIQS